MRVKEGDKQRKRNESNINRQITTVTERERERTRERTRERIRERTRERTRQQHLGFTVLAAKNHDLEIYFHRIERKKKRCYNEKEWERTEKKLQGRFLYMRSISTISQCHLQDQIEQSQRYVHQNVPGTRTETSIYLQSSFVSIHIYCRSSINTYIHIHT